MKTLKQILEVYSPKSADEKRFVKKHITVKTADVAGNGDDVFSGAKVKEIDRKATRKGYNTPDSEAVYEEEQINEIGDTPAGRKLLKKVDKRAFYMGGTKKGGKANMADAGEKTLQRTAARLKKEAIEPPKHYGQKGVQGAKLDAYMAQQKRELEKSRPTSAKTTKEEVEQVDELKKSTVSSYIQKKFGKMSDEPVSKNQYGYAKKDAKGIRNAGLRMSGIKATQKEEVEVNEVLKVSGGAGEWIKDFESSKNPKFAGKSKDQRKQQALAAFYSAKRAGKE